MASADSGNVADESVARAAAEVAVELSEAGGHADSGRVAGRLRGVGDRAAGGLASGPRPPAGSPGGCGRSVTVPRPGWRAPAGARTPRRGGVLRRSAGARAAHG